jgi:hypothetical protein
MTSHGASTPIPERGSRRWRSIVEGATASMNP